MLRTVLVCVLSAPAVLALEPLPAGTAVSSDCISSPSYARTYANIAGSHLKNGEPELALPVLREGLRECSPSAPDTAGIFRMLAIYHNLRLEYGPAKEYAEKGLALPGLSGRTHSGLYLSLASALGGLGDAAGTAEAARKGLALPMRGDALERGQLYLKLGSALAWLGDEAGAMAAYKDALILLPESDELRLYAHYGLAEHYIGRKEYAPAAQAARKGLAIPGRGHGRERGQLSLKLGEALERLGDAAGAIAAYKNALVQLPEGDGLRLYAHYGLAEHYIASVEYGPAAETARKGLAIPVRGYDHERGQLCLKSGEALTGLGDAAGAVKAYKNALSLMPKGDGQRGLAYQMYLRVLLNPELKIGLAEAEIFALLKEAKNLSGADEKVLLFQEVWDLLDRAYASFYKGSESGMAGTLREHGIPADNSVFNDFLWGHFYLRHNRPEEASARFLKILKSTPDSPVGYAGLENISMQAGDFMGVMKSFTKAERLIQYEYCLPIHGPLVAIYNQIENKVPPQLLGPMAAAYGELMPEYKSVLYSVLGLLYIKHGMFPEAKSALLSAMELPSASSIAHPEWPSAGLGLLAFKTADYEAAEKYFRKSLEIRPGSAQGACSLVHVYALTRRWKAAAGAARDFAAATQVQDTNITRMNRRSMAELLYEVAREPGGKAAPAAPPDIFRCFKP